MSASVRWIVAAVAAVLVVCLLDLGARTRPPPRRRRGLARDRRNLRERLSRPWPTRLVEPAGPRTPTLLDALLPVVVLILLLALTIVLFGVSATDGPLQVALLLSAAFASLIAFKNGYTVGGRRRGGRRRGGHGDGRRCSSCSPSAP